MASEPCHEHCYDMQLPSFAFMASGHAMNVSGACNSMKARHCGGYSGSLKLGVGMRPCHAAFPKACQNMVQHLHGAHFLTEYNQPGKFQVLRKQQDFPARRVQALEGCGHRSSATHVGLRFSRKSHDHLQPSRGLSVTVGLMYSVVGGRMLKEHHGDSWHRYVGRSSSKLLCTCVGRPL